MRLEIPYLVRSAGVPGSAEWVDNDSGESGYLYGESCFEISEPTVTAAGNFAKRLPSYLISFIVAILAAYFFTIQREEVIAWFHKIAPPSVERG